MRLHLRPLRLRPLVITLLLALAAGSASAADTAIQRCEGTDGRITYSNGTCPSGTRQQRTIEVAPALEVAKPDAAAPAPAQPEPVDEADAKAKAAAEKAAAAAEKAKEAKEAKDAKAKDKHAAAAKDATTKKADASAKTAPAKTPAPTTAASPGASPTANVFGNGGGVTTSTNGTRGGSASSNGTSTAGVDPALQGRVVKLSPPPSQALTPDAAREAEVEKRKEQLAACDDLMHQIEYAQQEFDAAPDNDRASAELALRRLQAEHTQRCMPPKGGKS